MIEDCAKGSLIDELPHAFVVCLTNPGTLCGLETRGKLITLVGDSAVVCLTNPVTRYLVCLTNPVTRCGARSGGGHVKGLL